MKRRRLIELYKPAIFCAGIKEKYMVQKQGIPMKQLHSYDSGGPYAGYKGAINFYHEIDRMINSKVWQVISGRPGKKARNWPPCTPCMQFAMNRREHR
jgi:nitrogenase molybdenum-iron protein alpha/beta subunit